MNAQNLRWWSPITHMGVRKWCFLDVQKWLEIYVFLFFSAPANHFSPSLHLDVISNSWCIHQKKETAGMGCTICVGFYCSLFSGLIRNISIYNMARPSKYSQNNVKVLKLWVKQKTISVHLEGLGRCIHGKVRPCFPYQISSAMAGDDFICNNQH